MEATGLQVTVYFFNMLLAGGEGKGNAYSTTKILALKLGEGKDLSDLLKEQYKTHFGEDISEVVNKVIDKDFEVMLYEVAKYHFNKD